MYANITFFCDTIRVVIHFSYLVLQKINLLHYTIYTKKNRINKKIGLRVQSVNELRDISHYL